VPKGEKKNIKNTGTTKVLGITGKVTVHFFKKQIILIFGKRGGREVTTAYFGKTRGEGKRRT